MIHAIMATWAFDEAKKREVLSRRCQKCRSEQIAVEEKINESVACEQCGVEIPPKTAVRREAREDKQYNK